MQQSKRFILTSLFAGITISVLANNLVSLITQFTESGYWTSFAYSAALLVFLVKYFVDDLTEEEAKRNGRTTRGNLILLVLAWIFFLLAALLLKNILISGFFWLVGLIFATIFICKRAPIENKEICKCSCSAREYLIQNIILVLFLFILLLPDLCSLLSSLYHARINFLNILCKISWQQAWSLALFLITIIFLCCTAAGNNTKGDN